MLQSCDKKIRKYIKFQVDLHIELPDYIIIVGTGSRY